MARKPVREETDDTPNLTVEEIYSATELRYLEYAIAANEDRAVPNIIDGMKPSTRRGLWTIYKKRFTSDQAHAKAAKVVGYILGDYHPHGDMAAYGAIVTFTNFMPHRLASGSGNWGSFSDDKVASYRYTLIRLSKYSEKVFFDKFYIPCIPTVLNYNSDPDYREPVYIPCLLPNALLNGGIGIGVGMSTNNPSYTLESVGKLVEKALEGQEVTPKLCAKYLKFNTLYEGEAVVDANDALAIMKRGKGRVLFKSTGIINVAKRTIELTKFPDLNLINALEKTSTDERVKVVNDISDVKDKHGRILIELKASVGQGNVTKALTDIVNKYWCKAENYDIYVTHRSTHDDVVER